jgi:hypothetical protein
MEIWNTGFGEGASVTASVKCFGEGASVKCFGEVLR